MSPAPSKVRHVDVDDDPRTHPFQIRRDSDGMWYGTSPAIAKHQWRIAQKDARRWKFREHAETVAREVGGVVVDVRERT